MTDKIDRQMAEAEFNRFAAMMELDFDISSMTQEDREGFDQQKNRFIRAIEKGTLVINDRGEPVYSTIRGEETKTLTFHEPTGAAFMAMDRKKKNEEIGKTYVLLAAITKEAPATFANMANADLKVCTAIMTLFMG